MVSLAISVAGQRRPRLEAGWSRLDVTDADGHANDYCALTVAVPEDFRLPPLLDQRLRIDAGGAQICNMRICGLRGQAPPRSAVIEGAGVDPAAAMRERRDADWSGQSLAEIAGAIADRAGLEAQVSPAVAAWTPPAAPPQVGLSDQAFLSALAVDADARLIVKDDRLVIAPAHDQADAPNHAIDWLAGDAFSLSWAATARDIVRRVTCRYVADDGATIAFHSTGSGSPAQLLPDTYGSAEAAKLAAEAALRSAAAHSVEVRVTVPLAPEIRAAHSVTLPTGLPRWPPGRPRPDRLCAPLPQPRPAQPDPHYSHRLTGIHWAVGQIRLVTPLKQSGQILTI